MKSYNRNIIALLSSIVLVSAGFITLMWVDYIRSPIGENGNDNDGDDQNDDPPNNNTTNLFLPNQIYSEEVGDTFKIYLELPDNYNQTEKRYPVVYVLDADYLFYGSLFLLSDGGVVKILQYLLQSELIPEVILVGIGYPGTNNRNRDFMYPASSFPPGSGGAHEFYAFLEKEFIPLVDDNLRTNTSERIAIGDSYGGNFLLFSIFGYGTNTSSLFRDYIAISPSISYYDYYLLDLEEIYYNHSFGILPINLHLSVGEDEWQDMVDGAALFNTTITTRNYSTLNYTYLLWPGMDHLSVVGPAISHGLEWAFSL